MPNIEHKDQVGDDAIHPARYVQEGDPGAVGAGKEWLKLTTAERRVRNAGNTAWTLIGLPSHTHAPGDITGTAVVTADSRLSDARTPLAHVHAPGDVTGTAVITTDGRLSDSRTPTAHKTSHENGGSDEISVAGLSGLLADAQNPVIGATGTTAVAGNDARLSDSRTPTAHVHSGADITSGTVVPARLGSGSGGATKFLREDSTYQAIVTDSIPHQTALYYGANLAGISSSAYAQNQLRVCPIFIPADATYTRIGINTTATALSTPRLGIYANSVNVPGALLLDAGTVDGTTTSFKEITISLALTRGWYWIGVSPQGASGSIQIGSANGINMFGELMPLDGAPGVTAGGYYVTAAGALPNPYGTPTGRVAIVPFVLLKI